MNPTLLGQINVKTSLYYERITKKRMEIEKQVDWIAREDKTERKKEIMNYKPNFLSLQSLVMRLKLSFLAWR